MDSRRKAEIEAKKQKLADLKRARLERQATLSDSKSGQSTPAVDRERGPSTRAQLDDLVASLLGSGATSPRDRLSSSVAGPSSATGLDKSISGRTSQLSHATASDRDRHDLQEGTSISSSAGQGQTSGTGQAGSVTGEAAPSQPQQQEVVQPIAPTLPPPKPKPTTYDKAIQTLPISEAGPSKRSTVVSTDDLEEEDEDEAIQAKTVIATEAEIRARILKEIEVQRDIERLEEEERRQKEEQQKNERLSGKDLTSIYESNDFLSFLDNSSKIIERAINDNYDYLRDYTIGDGNASADDQGKRVKRVCAFYDERWCKNRSVTSLDWSPKFPELSVAAYNKNAMSLSDPDGIACVWNLHLVERPEFVFHSQSDVLSVAFSPFHPNLLVGGTYAGQILIWDTRSKSLPVLKSPLSAAGHTHPIYSLSLIGTQNAHNLISASTDGTICSWTLDMLARPQETLELAHPQHPKTDEVSITSLAFQGNETTTMLAGTEEGNIYAVNRYDRAGAKAGLLPGEVYKGHSGPVLGLDYHPLAGPIDFSDLFLSCGVDWTVRLWRSKGANTSAAATSAAAGAKSGSALASAGIAPIHTFEEGSNYVLDAKWHPAHPALFGAVDAAGRFDLWNLNQDTEIPAVSTTVSQGDKQFGLNKLAWEKREGRHAAIGSSNGKVYIYDIGSLATPRENEWDLLRRTLTGLQSNDTVGR